MSWHRHPLALAAPLLLAAASLLLVHDLASRPVAALAALAVFAAGFVRAAVALRGRDPGASVVLLVAAALRLCLLPLPPTLSDDVYRYLWDGRITAAGWNPYFHSPDDTRLAPLRDVRWEQVAHRQVETVYPPAAIAAFSIAARLPRPLLAWKLLLVGVDLCCCGLLLRLARARGAPVGRCVAYGWNPLVVLEVAGMGHVDALGVAPLVAGALLLRGPVQAGNAGAVGALDPRATPTGDPGATPAGDPEPRARLRSLVAGAALGLAVLVKLVPLLVAPAWVRGRSRRTLFVLAGAAVIVLGVLPFAVGAPGAPPGLVTYAVSWEWNGPVFEPLWRALDAAGAAPWLKERLDELKLATGRHELWNRFYPYVYPQLLAKLLLASALAGVVAASLRRRDPVRAALLVFGGMLLLSATVYPWYALWVLPWAALVWSPAWIVLSLSLLLSYLPLLFAVPLLPWIFLSVWSPFLAALWWTRARPTG